MTLNLKRQIRLYREDKFSVRKRGDVNTHLAQEVGFIRFRADIIIPNTTVEPSQTWQVRTLQNFTKIMKAGNRHSVVSDGNVSTTDDFLRRL